MMRLLVIGLGGFVGAIARYGLSSWLARNTGGTFPWGTLTVNVLGCLCIGALLQLVEEQWTISAYTRLFLAVGLLGSFTTFSTFGYETWELLRSADYMRALLNISGNLILGIIAVVLGWAAAATLAR
jgi:CrcB protein